MNHHSQFISKVGSKKCMELSLPCWILFKFETPLFVALFLQSTHVYSMLTPFLLLGFVCSQMSLNETWKYHVCQVIECLTWRGYWTHSHIFYKPQDPWDWYIYLHEWFISMVNVRKYYQSHGSYGCKPASRLLTLQWPFINTWPSS